MEQFEQFFIRKNEEVGVSLNEVQKQAVSQTEGALLLLASPGSGKTTTIIMRIGYLLEQQGVDPERVKAVTFSRASAMDMKERFKRFFPELDPVDFSTIHSLAFEIMREHFYKTRTSFQIIEGAVEMQEEGAADADPDNPPLHKKLILRKIYGAINGDKLTEDGMEALSTYISFVKNKLIPQEQWPSVKCEVLRAERILREYEMFKRSGANKLLVDYDDMLTIANEALEGDAKLLQKYQQRYDYVLTDESQDTSMVQHAIIEKLVREHGNLCVVADDDQSIYTWRAAEPQYLLDFREVYPDASILFMEQNYRSSKDIVEVASQFIKRNKNRYDKTMFTVNPPHEPIRIVTLDDNLVQAKYLAERVQEVQNLRNVAILYRNNSSSIMLMNEFDRAGIPFYMKDADNRFFSHWVVEDILNFMRMSFTDKRADILEAIHTKLHGYITKHQIEVLKEINNQESVFDNLLNYVQLQDYQGKQLLECKETFQQMKGMPPYEAIGVIRSRLGYDRAIDKMSERLGFNKEYLTGILNTLGEIAATLDTMEQFAARLKHLESLLRKAKSNRNGNAVTFSTLHSAKGLEFQTVYMVDAVDGVLPSSNDCEKGNEALLEEATRLFYVGMTRAKLDLELVSYKERDGKKVKESPFVAAVRHIMNPPAGGIAGGDAISVSGPPEVPVNPNGIRSREGLVVGRFVKHRVFGEGEIVELTAERVHIRCNSGVKVLAVLTCLERGILEPLETETAAL
ncbi:Putative ATP-dependent DNA helicase YjcD [Paenibacillus plantiphilus]|uniref:DNA 3'-5' helicase n=1 Tax=Paenibacillus plantiphilus TaxID=2905650 RepID=A0ABM9CRZ8_9BACL|nr:ATP-dependent helicase [Paenibacillus plantiphilus]CAH1221835.1 Putative ATP-dependent DNA helicase YjcD [Paenibacillus plantiphilus]